MGLITWLKIVVWGSRGGGIPENMARLPPYVGDNGSFKPSPQKKYMFLECLEAARFNIYFLQQVALELGYKILNSVPSFHLTLRGD